MSQKKSPPCKVPDCGGVVAVTRFQLCSNHHSQMLSVVRRELTKIAKQMTPEELLAIVGYNIGEDNHEEKKDEEESKGTVD